jgi:2-hydroxy-6-oxonona-2,4-dienedioate hydrolase
MRTASTEVLTRYVDVDGLRTRYYEAGGGPPMVLVHGDEFGGAASASTWLRNLPGLARAFHVFALDRPGQGFTDNPLADADYTAEAVVAHLAGFVRTLGLDTIHLVGQSRGSYFAARLALEQPALVQTLVLVDTASLAPEVGNSQDRMSGIIASAPTDPREYAHFRWSRMSYSPAHITDDYLDEAVAIAVQPKMEAIRARRGEWMETFTPSLQRQKDETLAWLAEGRLTMPTLVVWGQNDPLAPLTCGQALFELLVASTPRARMYIFNQAGHYPYREHPDEFNAVVTSFVDFWTPR